MHPLLNGIYWGFVLAILVGPILFILIQAGIERGFRAGAMIGCGMWISDLMFVLLTYFGLSYLREVILWPGFELTLGIIGGVLLLSLGAITFLRPPPPLDNNITISDDYFSLWLKGFLVNTLNPFAVFFWIIITTTIVADNYIEGSEAAWFFFGLLSTIMITDCLKVLLAKGLRKWLTRNHILLVRHISGVVLLVCGLVFIVRAMLG